MTRQLPYYCPDCRRPLPVQNKPPKGFRCHHCRSKYLPPAPPVDAEMMLRLAREDRAEGLRAA